MVYKLNFDVTGFRELSRDILRDNLANGSFYIQSLSRDSVTPRVTYRGDIYIYPPLSRNCHGINVSRPINRGIDCQDVGSLKDVLYSLKKEREDG